MKQIFHSVSFHVRLHPIISFKVYPMHYLFFRSLLFMIACQTVLPFFANKSALRHLCRFSHAIIIWTALQLTKVYYSWVLFTARPASASSPLRLSQRSFVAAWKVRLVRVDPHDPSCARYNSWSWVLQDKNETRKRWYENSQKSFERCWAWSSIEPTEGGD